MCGTNLVSEDFSCPLESDRAVLLLQEVVTHTHHPILELFFPSQEGAGPVWRRKDAGAFLSREEHPLSSPIKELTGRGLFQTEPVFGPGSHPCGCLLAERPRELSWNRIAGCEGLSVCSESSGTCLILLGLMVGFLE